MRLEFEQVVYQEECDLVPPKDNFLPLLEGLGFDVRRRFGPSQCTAAPGGCMVLEFASKAESFVTTHFSVLAFLGTYKFNKFNKFGTLSRSQIIATSSTLGVLAAAKIGGSQGSNLAIECLNYGGEALPCSDVIIAEEDLILDIPEHYLNSDCILLT